MKNVLIIVTLVFFLGMSTGIVTATPLPPVMNHAEQGLDITVSWTTVPGATGYTLFYAPYPFMGVETIGSFDMQTATSASFTLWEGAAFYIAVQAYDATGSSDYSNIEYFIMGPPTPEWIDDDGDGFSEYMGDCNDSDPLVSPAQPDLCGDAIDQDCSGTDVLCNTNSSDGDKDGYTLELGDCDDGNPAIHPGAFDICNDGLDQDCSGADRPCTEQEIDNDFDGFTELRGDCNDGDSSISPGAVDVCEDGIDQDCSGSDVLCPENIDNDADGFTENQGDCNDAKASVFPGADDLCGDGIDQDCSGQDPVCAMTAEPPTISPLGGDYTYGQTVAITSSTDGAQIRYTTDGSSPALSSRLYTQPVQVNTTQTVKALAYKSGMNASPEVSASFIISPSLTGNWAVSHITGANNCMQTVGETIQFTAAVEQTGNNVTVTTLAGTGTGTINGTKGSWSTSQPVSSDSITGTLDFTMNVTIASSWNSFSGPTTFKFTGSPVNCSGVGTINGSRVQ